MSADVKDRKLAGLGKKRVAWAIREMPVVAQIRREFQKSKPLKGVRVSACLHVTTETAHLLLALRDAGAKIALCASNPLSTQDDVAAYLVREKVAVYAIKGEDTKRYYAHIEAVLQHKPHLTMDDGADLVSTVTKQSLRGVLGGTEETTTGVIRLRALSEQGKLPYPIIAVNDAITKHLFDNRFGTGQSTLDGIFRATNLLVAGKRFVVVGFGWCGRGIAFRAKGMGAQVIVVEVDPFRALEAAMEGFAVMNMRQAAKVGDVFVTATGDFHVISKEHFTLMKDGAVVANSGHFNVELDIEGLAKMAIRHSEVRPFVRGYTLKSGKTIFVLAEGRLVNLSAAEGHPAAVMDMSFANQAFSAVYLKERGEKLEREVHRVPEAIDRKIAELKLQKMGISIQRLTREQKEYLSSWELGT